MKDILNSSVLKTVDEAGYLTAQNVERYRAIMRFMYVEHQRMRYFLRKEDIYEFMKGYDIFKEYTLDECQNDLKVLVEKKNLIAYQDTSRAATLEEFKNKRFKYKLTDISIEIERLLERLENSTGVRGSLEPQLFEKILNYLKAMDKLENKPLKDTGEWWKDINRDFESINREYTDFISMLQGAKVESLISTEGFLIYKDKLVNYISRFISQLLYYQPLIEYYINSLNQEKVRIILSRVVDYEISSPRNFIIQDREVIIEDVNSKWQNITEWFGNGDGQSESRALIDATTDIIRRITSYALRIVESRNIVHNRKEEYKHLAKLFSKLDIGECNKLSSTVFGMFGTKHVKGDFIRESENINLSVWDTEPFEIKLKSRSKGFRERAKVNPIKYNIDEKQRVFEEYQRKKENEKKLLEAIVKNRRISFKDLPVITEDVRRQLLVWLCRGRDGKAARTDAGLVYKVVLKDKNERCTLVCTDGKLEMPAYEIIFEEGGV